MKRIAVIIAAAIMVIGGYTLYMYSDRAAKVIGVLLTIKYPFWGTAMKSMCGTVVPLAVGILLFMAVLSDKKSRKK